MRGFASAGRGGRGRIQRWRGGGYIPPSPSGAAKNSSACGGRGGVSWKDEAPEEDAVGTVGEWGGRPRPRPSIDIEGYDDYSWPNLDPTLKQTKAEALRGF